MGEAIQQGFPDPRHGLSLGGLGEGHVKVKRREADRVGRTVLELRHIVIPRYLSVGGEEYQHHRVAETVDVFPVVETHGLGQICECSPACPSEISTRLPEKSFRMAFM